MPVSFLSTAERERFLSFPASLADDEIIAHFTLSHADSTQIPSTTTPANRLGFALQLLTLRFLGFYLPDLTVIPSEVASYVAVQIEVPVEQIKLYTDRIATRTNHQRTIENYLGFRHPSEIDLQRISDWLLVRALEHDRPIVLLQLLCEHLLTERFVRPGFTVVERMVGAARAAAEIEIHRRLLPILDQVRMNWLDSLPKSPQPNRPSQLAHLRESAVSNSPQTILASLDKLKQLQQWRVGRV